MFVMYAEIVHVQCYRGWYVETGYTRRFARSVLVLAAFSLRSTARRSSLISSLAVLLLSAFWLRCKARRSSLIPARAVLVLAAFSLRSTARRSSLILALAARILIAQSPVRTTATSSVLLMLALLLRSYFGILLVVTGIILIDLFNAIKLPKYFKTNLESCIYSLSLYNIVKTVVRHDTQ